MGQSQEIGTRRLSRRRFLQRAGGALAGVAGLSSLESVATGGRAAASFSLQSGLDVSEFDAEVPVRWFHLLLDLVRQTPGFSPPVAARAFGYAGLALYEALVPGMPGYQSFVGQRGDFTYLLPGARRVTDHWPTVANGALAAVARLFFPTAPDELQRAIDHLQEDLLARYRGTVPSHYLLSSLVRGRLAAFQIFRWSTSDGGHEGYLHNTSEDFVLPVGDGRWEPTPPDYAPALQPYWGRVRTFVIGDPASIPVEPPPVFSTQTSSDFFHSALEVYEAVNNLTPEQEEIALFWADNPGETSTPPGHSISILNQIIVQQGVDLARAAEAYARVGMAVHDAFVCCWHTKYRFNLLRPITYIQRYIDPSWGDSLPVVTPPFPEYTSGHSVQSGAAATVLAGLFGELPFTDRTHQERGMAPRRFESFAAYADEAAISRLYGGIHYRDAIEVGLDQGRGIGEKLNELPLRTGG